MDAVTIYTQAQPLQIKEYQGQRVVTFKDIDTLHQRPEGTADRNFRENISHFIEGEDYFKLSKSLNHEIRGLEIPNRGITVFTQFGYLMLVKSFTDDLAWSIHRQLVKNYFNGHTAVPEQLPTLPGKSIQPKISKPQSKEADNAVKMFLDALKDLLASGKCSVASLNDVKEEKPLPANSVGFYDNNFYYLNCERVYSAVYRHYAEQKICFDLTKNMLLKILENNQSIVIERTKTRKARTKMKHIGKTRVRCLWLRKSALQSV